MRVAFLVALLVAASFAGMQAPPASADSEEPVLGLAAARYDAAVARVGGDLFVIGGRAATGATVNEIVRFNLTTGQRTTTLDPLPSDIITDCFENDEQRNVASRAEMGVAADDRYVWLFGGVWRSQNFQDCAIHTSVLRFDTVSGAVTQVADLGMEIYDPSAVRVGGTIYLFGGNTCQRFASCSPAGLNGIWAFDTTTNAVRKLAATMPVAAGDAPALLADGRVLVFPAIVDHAPKGEYEFFPANETLLQRTNATNVPRGAVAWDGAHVVSFGGAGNQPSGYYAPCCSALFYDPVSRTSVSGAVTIGHVNGAFVDPASGEARYVDENGVRRWEEAEPVLAPDDATASFSCTKIYLQWRERTHQHPVDGFRVRVSNATGVVANASWSPWDGRQRTAGGLHGFYHSNLTVANGTAYSVQVEAVKGAGETEAVASVTLTGSTAPPPRTPTGLNATAGAEWVNLSWTPRDITRVERESGAGWVTLGVVGRTTGAFNDTTAQPDTTYRYRLVAQDCGESPPTDPLTVRTWGRPVAPAAPTLARGPGAGEITIQGAAPVSSDPSPITGYRFYEVVGGSPTFLGQATGPTWRATGLSPGSTHVYRFAAVNAYGEGDLSPSATGSAPVAPDAPRSPAAARGPGAGQISLTWSPPSSNGGTAVTSYRVYRVDGAALTLLATVNATSYVHGGNAAGAVVTYAVAAVNGVGEGPRSASFQGSAPVPPTAPRDVEAEVRARAAYPALGIEVSWLVPADHGGTALTGYRVERAIGGSFTQVATRTAAQLSYFDDSCPILETCTYRVRAVNAVGASVPSAAAGATGTDPLP